jgi:endonuclease I
MNLILFFVLSLLSRRIVTFDWLIALVSFSQVDPPKTYYAKAIGKTGRAFRSALHDIIDVHRVIKYSSKNPDTADALANLDADPGNPNSVILIYSRRSEAIANFGTSGGWNREHLWCNSYGIDKRGPAYSDLHNLKPADASVNSAPSNKIFDISDTRDAKYQKPGHPEAKLTSENTDSWEPPTEVRGEIARAAFYMDVRYSGDKSNENDLQLTNDLSVVSSDTVFLGNLDTLLEWYIAGPVDAAERTRNDLVYRYYQKNRNPFVDHPEWVVAIYGSTTSEPCVLSLPTIDGESLRFDLKLTAPGRNRLLRSIDLINWTSVAEFEASLGNRQLKQPLFGSTCFFQVRQRPDGD